MLQEQSEWIKKVQSDDLDSSSVSEPELQLFHFNVESDFQYYHDPPNPSQIDVSIAGKF